MSREKRNALKVSQWMPAWSQATWGAPAAKPMPPKSYYLCSMPILALRALSGTQPRTTHARKVLSKNAGFQRAHDKERSQKIGRYLEYGYPVSSSTGINPTEHPELINPGWLPTAILVNVLGANDERQRGSKKLKVSKNHLVNIVTNGGASSISYPTDIAIDASELAPLEVIDGQHRLLSVDELEDVPDDYEVPVVVFDGLPLVWQAYLFWVINVEPKKINPSLAFDLYPELRNQDWLERGESIKVYQEHRAQELAEALWKHPLSPWYERIELFGKRVDGHVSNAAVIRSLAATFVRRWGSSSEPDEMQRIGGLFGSLDKLGKSYVLHWKRSQQAAFLLKCWQCVFTSAKSSRAKWADALRQNSQTSESHRADVPFVSGFSLLATDQGFRAISFAYNAICQTAFDSLKLADWFTRAESEPTIESISACLAELDKLKVVTSFLEASASVLVNNMDWRTSSAPGLNDNERVVQGQFRGSSGYAALNKAALRTLALSKNQSIRSAAKNALILAGWDHGE